ncbi:MAG: hypothetical protein NC548_45025 [Lachnospiraceae bacterium]|nr:hypothetical protein [Lachnospiraceae bacterium]
MIKIPKYIVQDIEKISRYAEKIEPLIIEVESWYDKNMSAYDDMNIPEEEFNNISHNERNLKEFTLEHIKENFRIVEEAMKDT